MEVIVRNLADEATPKQIDDFFKGVLEKHDIKTYFFQKLRGRGCATITIHDDSKARLFLHSHGQTVPGARGFPSVQRKLFYRGRPVWCLKSRNEPEEYLLLALKKEESDRYLANQKKPRIVPPVTEALSNSARNQRAWDISNVQCGQWIYRGGDLTFAAYCQEKLQGRLVFGQRTLRINLGPHPNDSQQRQIEIPYKTIESFTIGSNTPPSVTLSLSEAPKFFDVLGAQEGEEEATDMQAALNLQKIGLTVDQISAVLQKTMISHQTQQYKRRRISALSPAHGEVVGSCLCYRFLLSHLDAIAGIIALKRFFTIPDSISWNTSSLLKKSFHFQMEKLKLELTGEKYGSIPFGLKYQLQRLAQNGILKPTRVVELIPVVFRYLEKQTPAVVIQSVRSLVNQVPFAGPATDSSELSLKFLTDSLIESQEAISQGDYFSAALDQQYDHIAAVQKATVTPAGIYLFGPEPEIKNRVLRKYSAYLDYFLSVSFLDEDGETLRLDRQTSGKDIYHRRYKNVLQSGINIAGRQYEVSRCIFKD